MSYDRELTNEKFEGYTDLSMSDLQFDFQTEAKVFTKKS